MASLFSISKADHNAAPRERWLERALGNISSGSRLLDAGAGELSKQKYCTHLDYVSQDFGEYTGEGNGAGLQTGTWDQSRLDIVCDICSIPEPDASFDAILCVEVLEHLPDPLLALREFSRLLKPGGQLILTAPFCCCTHFAPHFYSTGFSRYWYERHLPEAGFAIEELSANGNFSSYLLQEVGRIPFIAKKYTEVRLSLLDRLGLRLVKALLSRMLGSDKGSHEFSTFGYHVRAIKK